MSDDYSFMGVNVDDAKDKQILPEETEAMLRVKEAVPYPEHCSIRLVCEITQAPNAGDVDLSYVPDVGFWLFYPKAEDDDKKRNNKLLSLKKFREATRLQAMPSSPDEFVGLEFWGILGIEDSVRYGRQNTVAALQNPR